METIKLSDKYTIYKDTYDNEYPINDFLKLVEFNHQNVKIYNEKNRFAGIEMPNSLVLYCFYDRFRALTHW